MSDLKASVDATIRRFDNALNASGFETMSHGDNPKDWQWQGNLPGSSEAVTVKLPEGFPFMPPRVTLPKRDTGNSWHAESDGALCLWDSHASGSLPWLDHKQLLERTQEWVTNEDEGWVKDSPDLDLERYYSSWIDVDGKVPLLVVSDWDKIAERWFMLRGDISGRIEPEGRPRTSYMVLRSKNRTHIQRFMVGRALNLGELAGPRVTREELLQRLGTSRTGDARELLHKRQLVVVARYTRQGLPAYVSFVLSSTQSGVDGIFVIPTAESRPEVLTLRGGNNQDILSKKRVAVVGVGAVGSFLVDQLARSGVGHLHLVDYAKLRPGNVIRHLSGQQLVGASKTDAVIARITGDRCGGPEFSTAPFTTTVDDTQSLLTEYDLVINATGDRLTQQLLQFSAEILGKTFLQVCVEGHGQFARVDVCPPLDGAPPLTSDGLLPVDLTLREGGCGDPISPTPPSVCIEAACMGARHAIGLLTARPLHPAGERRPMGPT
ncbi:MAG: ThiF family adenylyltransferase [Actinomycetota bacterium]